jgi:anti-anti-sigma factor
MIAAAAPYRERMTVRSAVVGDELLLLVDGTVDGAVAPELHRQLSAADHLAVGSVVVDLAEAPHIDDGGIAVLAAAAHVLGARGVPLWLHLSHGRTVRVTDASSLRAVLSPDGQAETA